MATATECISPPPAAHLHLLTYRTHRFAGDTSEIETVPRSVIVHEISPEMCTAGGCDEPRGLVDANVIADSLRLAERWPPVHPRLTLPFIKGSAYRSAEER